MPGVGALTDGGDVLAMFGLAAIGFAVPASRSLLEQHLPPQVTARTRRWDVEVDSLQVTGVATQVSATMHDPARQRR